EVEADLALCLAVAPLHFLALPLQELAACVDETGGDEDEELPLDVVERPLLEEFAEDGDGREQRDLGDRLLLVAAVEAREDDGLSAADGDGGAHPTIPKPRDGDGRTDGHGDGAIELGDLRLQLGLDVPLAIGGGPEAQAH